MNKKGITALIEVQIYSGEEKFFVSISWIAAEAFITTMLILILWSL